MTTVLERLFQNKYIDMDTLQDKFVQQLIEDWNNYKNGLKSPMKLKRDINDVVTSELGLLLLDRTRLRPNGFCIGEFLGSRSLGPGNEMTVEQKSTFKEVKTVEDVMEREFELTMENSSESSIKDDVSNQNNRSKTDTSTTGVGGNVSGDFASTGVPVEANVGANASSTTQQAVSNANSATSQLSRNISSKISSKLRKNHKTTITTSQESLFESSTRTLIKNPNKGTSLTYIFFKVMQQIEASVERTGARICWAPFVKRPGTYTSRKMDLAEKRIFMSAKTNLNLPAAPSPPSQVKKERLTGKGVYITVHGDISEDNPKSIRVAITISRDDVVTWVGIAHTVIPEGVSYRTDQYQTDGDGPEAEYARIQESNGKDTLIKTIYVTANNGHGTIRFHLQADVLPMQKKYLKEMTQYKEELKNHKSIVAMMLNEMREEVKPLAVLARQQVLERTDMRSELLHSVIRQYILPSFRDEAAEIELWHRIIDFDNIGFKLYPYWWISKDIPFPELPNTHFLNASWVRVFLPIKPGYEEYAIELIFRDKGKEYISTNKILDGLKNERKKHIDDNGNPISEPINVKWNLSVPTDGTHIETILGSTFSLDHNSTHELIAQARERAQAEIDNLKADLTLKQAATQPPNVNITIV